MSGWSREIANHGRLGEQEAMARHTTLGVGGPARWFFRPDSRAGLVATLKSVPAELPLLPLGRGSNMLVPDEGFPGMVIDLGSLTGLAVDNANIDAEAGVSMGKLARAAADASLTGLEFMATVPGDIGGGIVMNAGAFGQQVSDTLVSIDVVLRSGEELKLQADELKMHYRHTELPAGAIVLAGRFALEAGDKTWIRSEMQRIRESRSASQPLSKPNCGSVFKNPANDHAGRLIEAAGLKGRAIGGARISEQHANFIVNEGEATSTDVISLIRLAQQEVRARFDVELEPEVRILEVRQ